MSTCPSKDLHSVYLDNELPEMYREEYEAHIRTCTNCQKQINALRAVHYMFAKDDKEITPDSTYLNQSYERLMIKMKYRNTVVKADEGKKTGNLRKISYFVSAVAAAAIFATVLPVSLNSKHKINDSYIPKVTDVATLIIGGPYQNLPFESEVAGLKNHTVASSVALNSGKTVVISGNIDEAVLGRGQVRIDYSDGFQTAQNISTNIRRNSVDALEVFRPEFSASIPVYRITLPEF